MTLYNENFNETYPFSDTSCRLALATGVAQTYTVPGTSDMKYKATFSYASNSNVIVGLNVTPTVPAAGTKETTQNIEYKPCSRYVKGGDDLIFITGDGSAVCGVSLLKLPS